MKKRLKIIIPVILIAAVALWLLIWMRAPSEGQILSVPASPTQTVQELKDKTLDGTYISFQFGGKYTASPNSPSNNDLERYTLSAGTTYDKRILAAVVNLPEKRLEANGDYMYRQKTPSVYSKRLLKTPSGVFEIWVNNNKIEQTAMAAHGDKAIIMSFMTTAGADADLGGEVDTVLKSLTWKR